MRFRLPKPMHGWRAFAGEVGVIVFGVLIALAAQEAAEELRERQHAREARELIREELATFLGRLESRWALRGCTSKRLSELQLLLDRATAGQPIEQPRWIGRPQFWTMLTVRWDAASQSGRAALIPAAELAEYATMYDWMRNTYDSMLIEQTDWARLRAIIHLKPLTPPMAAELNLTLQDARYRAWRIDNQTEDLREIAARVNLPSRTNTIRGTHGTCLPMTMPYAEATKLSPAGEP